jgi:hypothetical protein
MQLYKLFKPFKYSAYSTIQPLYMFYKKHFFAIAILFFTLAASAQDGQVVPGLRGKRLFVEGNFSCLPFLVQGPTLENQGRVRYSVGKGTTPDGLPLSWRAGVLVHYITKRKQSVYGGIEHFQTGLSMEAFTKPIGTVANGNWPLDRHFLFVGLTANIITLGIETNTKSGMLAPIGSYFRFNLQYYLLQGKILDKYTDYSTGTRPPSGIGRPLGLDNVTSWDLALGMELGTRTVIAKNVTFNIGLRSTISAMWVARNRYEPLYSSASLEKYYTGSDDEIQAYNRDLFQENARLRTSIHDLLMLNIGLGYAIK